MADRRAAAHGMVATRSDALTTGGEPSPELARILAAKVEQGYVVESQSEHEAVLVTRGRRRWLGLRGHQPRYRQRVAVDGEGRTTMRKC